jgi:hypothetical protein
VELLGKRGGESRRRRKWFNGAKKIRLLCKNDSRIGGDEPIQGNDQGQNECDGGNCGGDRIMAAGHGAAVHRTAFMAAHLVATHVVAAVHVVRRGFLRFVMMMRGDGAIISGAAHSGLNRPGGQRDGGVQKRQGQQAHRRSQTLPPIIFASDQHDSHASIIRQTKRYGTGGPARLQTFYKWRPGGPRVLTCRHLHRRLNICPTFI